MNMMNLGENGCDTPTFFFRDLALFFSCVALYEKNLQNDCVIIGIRKAQRLWYIPVSKLVDMKLEYAL